MKLKERLNRFLDEIEEEVSTPKEEVKRDRVVIEDQTAFGQELQKEMVKESSFTNIDLASTPKQIGELSVIAADAKVFGDVSTPTSLQVNGSVMGNIACGKHLILHGDVQGDIRSDSLEVKNCVLRGNISCEQDVVVDANSEIHGDCWNDNISLQGLIRGNIYSKGKIRLYSSAEVIGNVSGSNIVVDDGALIQGNIKIKRS